MTRSEEHVERLLASYARTSGALQHINSYHLPNRQEVERALTMIRELIYPGFVNLALIRATESELAEHLRQIVESLTSCLRQQIYRALHHKVQMEKGTADLDCPWCANKASEIVDSFLLGLGEIREKLAEDVAAHYEGDPAASGPDEVIFCYPGLYAITSYRVANALYRLGAKLVPRMIASLAHEKVGIDIHPAATIGDAFFIDHGTGVVVGETCKIGSRVRIYQGVTLGALSVRNREDLGAKRHPTIEDDVIVYAGATILGGNTVIGKGAVIGGNCWVTESVPPQSKIAMHSHQDGG